MEDKDTFKKLLGVTQEEIATILGITRSQWSMHEIGKRGLPLSAALEYTKMLQYVQENSLREIDLKYYSKEEDEKQILDQFNREIKKNEFKIHKLNKKIEETQLCNDDGLAALRIAEYLDTQPENERIATVKKLIRCKAMANLQKNKELLHKYNLNKQILQSRNEVFKKEMKNILKNN
ncbi:helix-turn-helix domain-containing protein [Flavobacterium amniphilum]|uniref:helix-turn-helix domain-containing protein n=1 Tax=Flavobacterium amniphilum TaxID=1834035 RepID=UPI00202A1031|nr:helix-turn-helix transcriptional regulator [Flavobacterium amniphilum]MCL9805536.1 helix-turn-helix domain-containing protein [Flavobacterium amniphilum]